MCAKKGILNESNLNERVGKSKIRTIEENLGTGRFCGPYLMMMGAAIKRDTSTARGRGPRGHVRHKHGRHPPLLLIDCND